MSRSIATLAAALGASAFLSACDKPINDGPHPPADSPTAAATPAPADVPSTSGGPAGQTPAYGQAGAAPSQVTSQPDQTGPSDSDSSGSVR